MESFTFTRFSTVLRFGEVFLNYLFLYLQCVPERWKPNIKTEFIYLDLIVNKRVSREYPLGKIAERTIGYERLNSQGFFSGVGLEHGFGTLLRGKDGFEIQRKIYNGQWKALDNENKKEPINIK